MSFVTIWIFARIKRNFMNHFNYFSFVTIWIFARIKLNHDISVNLHSFVTIWIFARIKLNFLDSTAVLVLLPYGFLLE